MDQKEEAQANESLELLKSISEKQWLLAIDFDNRLRTIYDHRTSVRQLILLLESIKSDVQAQKPESAHLQSAIEWCEMLKDLLANKFKLILADTEKDIELEAKLIREAEETLAVNQRRAVFEQAKYSEQSRLAAFKVLATLAEARRKSQSAIQALPKNLKEIVVAMKTIQQSERDIVAAELALVSAIEDRLRRNSLRAGELDSFIFNLADFEKKLESVLREERVRVIVPLQKLLGEEQHAIQLVAATFREAANGKKPITAAMVARDIATLTDPSELQRYQSELLTKHGHLLEDNAKLLLRQAGFAGARIQESRFYQMEHFRNLAAVDTLTGAYRRQVFEQQVEQLLRARAQFSIIFMDIDHFKSFNDTYGHNVGDAVLRKFTDILRGTLRRKTDLLCRYGGEEFVVLLPGDGKQAAFIVAEALRRAVEAESAPMMREINAKSALKPELQRPNITASMGVATFPEDLEDYPPKEWSVELITGKADDRLYQAKHSGRNRVIA